MEILVVGASGATGRLLVAQLLERGFFVRAIIRPTAKLPSDIAHHDHL
ncbi:MAG: NAD(P)H-binding protein, partial [Gammaproteobacteria bacterium]|nr:NAD(P)H-binding protein [Gammaproteobacteria bacterium]